MSKDRKDVGGDYSGSWTKERGGNVYVNLNENRAEYSKSIKLLSLKEEHLQRMREKVLEFIAFLYEDYCWDYEEVISSENMVVLFTNPRILLEFDKCDLERVERNRKEMLDAGHCIMDPNHLDLYWDMPIDWFRNKTKYWENCDKEESTEDHDEKESVEDREFYEKIKKIKERMDQRREKEKST